MSDDLRFERNARAWLELGPVQAPERVVRAALATVDTTPQQRTIRIPWRLPSTKLSPRFAMAAAVVIVVIAAGFLLWRNDQSQIAAPATATPLLTSPLSPLATPALSPQSIHDLLSTKWVANADHATPDAGGFYRGGWVKFNDGGMTIDLVNGKTVNPWSIQADGTLSTSLTDTSPELEAAQWGCTSGDAGTYQVAFSAGDALLTLTPINETCAARAAILDGSWSRWPCPNPDSVCGAELSPGSHVTNLPGVPTHEGETPFTALISFSYTVPAGWSEVPWAGLGRPNDPGVMGIFLTQDVFPHAQDCQVGIGNGYHNASSDIADYLASTPGLVTTASQPVSIDGLSGVMLDASIASTWTQTCGQLVPAVFTIAVPIFDPDNGNSFSSGFLEGDGRARYIILDLSPQHNLLIEVTALDEASFSDMVQAAMPIIDTFQFEREVH